MKTYTTKRDYWTNEEVMELIDGNKLSPHPTKPMPEWAEQYNAALDDVKNFFFDFVRPHTEFGAMAYIVETKEVVHIGGIPPR